MSKTAKNLLKSLVDQQVICGQLRISPDGLSVESTTASFSSTSPPSPRQEVSELGPKKSSDYHGRLQDRIFRTKWSRPILLQNGNARM
jgi:hypothetical protein